jgi:hypothetical protein
MSQVPCPHMCTQAASYVLPRMIFEQGPEPEHAPVSVIEHEQRKMITYKLDISLLFELSSNEGPHLRVFFPCVQRRTCRKPQL